MALWIGFDDVARNSSVEVMKHILGLVINSDHTNVIMMTVSHRQDLTRDACVNNRVKVFDRRLG